MSTLKILFSKVVSASIYFKSNYIDACIDMYKTGRQMAYDEYEHISNNNDMN